MRPDRPGFGAGSAAIIVAALMWGTNGLAVSFLPTATAAPTVAAARLLTGGLLFLALRPTAIPRQRGRCPHRDPLPHGGLGPLLSRRSSVAQLAVAAASMASYQALYFVALRLTGVAVGSVVIMTSLPIFTGVITKLTTRTGPPSRWYAGTALAVAGSVILALARPTGHLAGWGVLCALAAGASYAVFTTACSALMRLGGDCRTPMMVILLTAGVVLSPALIVFPSGWLVTGSGIAVVGYLAGVSTVAAYLLYGRGLRVTPVATATTLTLAEPACATVIGILVLHEAATLRTAAGLTLVATALIILTIPAAVRAAGPRTAMVYPDHGE